MNLPADLLVLGEEVVTRNCNGELAGSGVVVGINLYSAVIRIGDRSIFVPTSLIDGLEDRAADRALGL